jgi:hypothetical protein
MRESQFQEHFYLLYLGMKFDVNKAKKIVNYPHNKVDANVPVSSLMHALTGTDLNKRYAMKTSDLKLPIILGTMGEMHFVFDGHHRIYKAYKQGRKTLPAYILTEEETREVVNSKKLFDKLCSGLPTPVGIKGKLKRKYHVG